MPADTALIDKLQNILKPVFPESLVDVTPSGVRDNVHVMVISHRFADMTDQQKQDYLWNVIDSSDLSQEQKLRISMILPLSPRDVK
jgi:hypothetical protein